MPPERQFWIVPIMWPSLLKLLPTLIAYFGSGSTARQGTTSKQVNMAQLNMNEGRGYDLKLILRPNTSKETNDNGNIPTNVPLLRIDSLVPGILTWIIQTLRGTINMKHSPIHLTLSFMYFSKLGREDLGDLSGTARVTRLNLWNPSSWEEDSFIPLPTSRNDHGQPAPPYFRLTLFCDHENKGSSFRRLWFPWKTWQVRFNHCPTLYVCRAWNSQYPICDQRSSSSSAAAPNTFMPYFYIQPKLLSGSVPNPSLNKMQVPYGSGLQILFNSQCEREHNLYDPVNDLNLDPTSGCWHPGAFTPKPEPTTPVIPSKYINSRTTKTIDRESVLPSTERVPTTPVTTTTTTTTTPKLRTTQTRVTMSTDGFLKRENKLKPSLSHVNGHEPFVNSSSSKTEAANVNDTKRSVSRLTLALVLLAIFNIVLLICFILLVLWIRRKVSEKRARRITQNDAFLKEDFGNPRVDSYTPLMSHKLFGSHPAGLNYTPRSMRPPDAYSLPGLTHHYHGDGYRNPNFVWANENYLPNSVSSNDQMTNGSIHMSLPRQKRRKSSHGQAQPLVHLSQLQNIDMAPMTASHVSDTATCNNVNHMDKNLSPKNPWAHSNHSFSKDTNSARVSSNHINHKLRQSNLIVFPQNAVSKSSISKSIDLLNRTDNLPASVRRPDQSPTVKARKKFALLQSDRKPHTLVFEDAPDDMDVPEALQRSFYQFWQ